MHRQAKLGLCHPSQPFDEYLPAIAPSASQAQRAGRQAMAGGPARQQKEIRILSRYDLVDLSHYRLLA
ncbi:MAG: hypothetical protein KAT27_02325 [Desulfobacterales bacterium]|nr:hypothetical protein [Desulfobacterales bacterium]